MQDYAEALIRSTFFSALPLRKSNPHTGPLEELTLVSTGSRFSETNGAGDMCVSVCMVHVHTCLRLHLPV